jgi:hypothetical protein
MDEKLADQLNRLCCAETEGKFFDCVAENIDKIISALRDRDAIIDECARIVEHWALPTIQTPSMWLVDKAGIAADIRALALSRPANNSEAK